MTNLIPLPELGHALMAAYGTPSPGYQHTYKMIAKGLLKPIRLGGRLFFERENLPAVARVLGIVPVKAPARKAERIAP